MNTLISLTALGFYGIAILGVLFHAVWKWSRGEIEVSLYSYFFQTNKRASVYMLLASIGGTAGLLLAGTVSNLQDGAHVLAVWGIGFAADSGLNSAKTKEIQP